MNCQANGISMLAFKLQNYNQQLLLFGGDFAIGKLRVFVSFVAHDLNLQELEILAFRNAFDRESNRSMRSSHVLSLAYQKTNPRAKVPRPFPMCPFCSVMHLFSIWSRRWLDWSLAKGAIQGFYCSLGWHRVGGWFPRGVRVTLIH